MEANSEFAFSRRPLVSVVTTAYNEDNYIQSNMQSISSQTYNNIEHIVVDDGSIDQTADVIEDFSHRKSLKFISHGENQGQLKATETAFEAVEGEIILWVNADDVLLQKNCVENVVEEYTENPDTQVLYGDFAIIDENGMIKRIKKTHPYFSYRRLKLDNFSAFICFRRDTLQEFQMQPECRYVMDYAFALKLANNGANFKYTSNIILGHRLHEDTITNQLDSEMTNQSRRYRNEEHDVSFDTMFRLQQKMHFYEMIALQVTGVFAMYSIYNNKDGLTEPVKMSRSLRDHVFKQLPI